jgi:hypothetical protein
MIRPALRKNYKLHIPEEIARQLRRCRVSMRAAIRAQLDKIAAIEAARPSTRRPPPSAGPPLRFYTSECYRVSYRIDRLRRKVVVLSLIGEIDA